MRAHNALIREVPLLSVLGKTDVCSVSITCATKVRATVLVRYVRIHHASIDARQSTYTTALLCRPVRVAYVIHRDYMITMCSAMQPHLATEHFSHLRLSLAYHDHFGESGLAA